MRRALTKVTKVVTKALCIIVFYAEPLINFPSCPPLYLPPHPPPLSGRVLLENVHCNLRTGHAPTLPSPTHPPSPLTTLTLTHTCRSIALILHVWSIQAEIATGRKHVSGGTPKWDPTKIKGLVGVSGVYNCADLRQHFNQRGLYYSLFDRIMSFQGKTQLKALSPTYVVHGARYAHLMPPVLLLHGTRDTCAPLHNATQFTKALLGAGIQVCCLPFGTVTVPACCMNCTVGLAGFKLHMCQSGNPAGCGVATLAVCVALLDSNPHSNWSCSNSSTLATEWLLQVQAWSSLLTARSREWSIPSSSVQACHE